MTGGLRNSGVDFLAGAPGELRAEADAAAAELTAANKRPNISFAVTAFEPTDATSRRPVGAVASISKSLAQVNKSSDMDKATKKRSA